MLRSLKSVGRYWKSLTKESMESRTKIFQADILYNENSILYNFDISLHPGESYEGISEIKFNIPQHDFSEG